MAAPGGSRPATSTRRARGVVACVGDPGAATEHAFSATFVIGSAPECELRIAGPDVEPNHVQVAFDGRSWWVRNLARPERALLDGAAFQFSPLRGEARLQLGQRGPVVSLRVTELNGAPAQAPAANPPPAPARSADPGELTEDEIIRRYMNPAAGAAAGKQTMMFRAAFQTVQRRSRRRYHVAIGAVAGVLLVALVGAAGFIRHQRQKLHALQASAERFFYAMKTLEVRTAQLEEAVLASVTPEQAAALGQSRERLRQMEGEYDAFVRELGVYGRLSERQRHILRVARRFGECDANVSGSFVSEVEHYVERWRQNPRFLPALRKAKQRGYGAAITRAFGDAGLPPQFVYLALQESAFDERAVGPSTRYGHAKGMWQFIALTGHQYGLRIGPRFEEAVYDLQDERFDWPKATRAAVKYLRKLMATDAQGSGLLAMASYNWGEDKVRPIIAAMPENPQERNFWQLVRRKDVPRETYDYVLSIVSAAVICEDPAFFGFDVECPTPPQPRIDERGRDRAR